MVSALTLGFLFGRKLKVSSRHSDRDVEAKTASRAAPRASATDCFFSLNLSIIGDMMVDRYFANPLLRPSANFSTQFAATVTTAMLASFMHFANVRTNSSNGASLILGVFRSLKRASRASLRSFHFVEPTNS